MDLTVKRIEEMDSVYEGVMVKARASLGVRSFGMQIVDMPPNFDLYPEHDEKGTGQEEVYVALRGSGRLIVGGSEHHIEPGVFARVGPNERRRLVPGGEGLRVLVLGGKPGEAYAPAQWTELGSSGPIPEK